MPHNLKRRHFLQTTFGLALAGAANASGLCTVTPAQTEGPFYPGEQRMLPVNDLTRVEGASRQALGQVIYLQGRVQDMQCQPLAGVNVEIWQACASGRYNNDRDTNPAPLDPNFRYWGETFTDKNGEYSFKTIMPGAYPADTDWDRPPHIHFRLAKLGFHELITQLYFKGHPLNNDDKILSQIPKSRRELVIVEFMPNPADISSLIGTFDISLERV